MIMHKKIHGKFTVEQRGTGAFVLTFVCCYYIITVYIKMKISGG